MAAKSKAKTKKNKTAKANIGTRRSNLKKKRSPKKFTMAFTWVKRLGFAALAIMIISWAGIWFFLSGADEKSSNWLNVKAVSISADLGFRVENILVKGREHSDADILLALINVEKGDPMFSFNPKEAKEQIEKIGWIKSARVERRLPDTIYIRLIEREPLALWQDKGGLSLIDANGEVITKSDLNKFKELLMVSGRGAAEKARELIPIINTEYMFKSIVDNAKLVDNRRWDLYLHDGKLIKLPESDIALALQNIMLRHKGSGILNSDSITVIDARYKGRLIIRTKLGKVQDYRAEIEH